MLIVALDRAVIFNLIERITYSFVVVGHSADGRPWEEAIKYGFISAGGGEWYSNTLALLSPDDRVWVKAPGYGFVGVIDGPDEVHLRVVARNELKNAKEGLDRNSSFFRTPRSRSTHIV